MSERWLPRGWHPPMPPPPARTTIAVSGQHRVAAIRAGLADLIERGEIDVILVDERLVDPDKAYIIDNEKMDEELWS